jgi:hypothetical protein
MVAAQADEFARRERLFDDTGTRDVDLSTRATTPRCASNDLPSP